MGGRKKKKVTKKLNHRREKTAEIQLLQQPEMVNSPLLSFRAFKREFLNSVAEKLRKSESEILNCLVGAIVWRQYICFACRYFFPYLRYV